MMIMKQIMNSVSTTPTPTIMPSAIGLKPFLSGTKGSGVLPGIVIYTHYNDIHQPHASRPVGLTVNTLLSWTHTKYFFSWSFYTSAAISACGTRTVV